MMELEEINMSVLSKQITSKGYRLDEVVSALQKTIRRAEVDLAGYWGCELMDSGFIRYAWKRLMITSAEDVYDMVTNEILALHDCHLEMDYSPSGRPLLLKAIIILCRAKKSRDADHLGVLVYERNMIDAEKLAESIKEFRGVEIPDYAVDCHTERGRKKGMTKDKFINGEHLSLIPRQAGLFDGLLG